jgi:hypothetical protein
LIFIRNQATDPEYISPEMRAAVESPDDYASLVSRRGDTPSAGPIKDFVDTWLWHPGEKVRPEWMSDLENVRVVHEGIAKTLLSDVFSSAPRGAFASTVGALNALARANTIYLPYGGTRYVTRNTVQNAVLLAVTQPKAFARMRGVVTTMRRDHNDLYEAWKSVTGTPQASAGLPDLPGSRLSQAQRVEGALTDVSRGVATKLSNIGDEPWRISSGVQYAREYGFRTFDEQRRLLTSDDPAIARIRSDIGQKVRDDMLDFDALPPGAAAALTRAFFIVPFKYAAAKWPLMYAREYPIRVAMAGLIANQHAREDTPGRVTSALEAGRTEIGGREIDTGWMQPHLPAAEMVEDAVNLKDSISDGKITLRPIARQLTPQARSFVDASGGFGEPVEQVYSWAIPGYSTLSRVQKGGGPGEQALRAVGSTIDYIEPLKLNPTERAKAKIAEEREEMKTLMSKAAPNALKNGKLSPKLQRVFSRKQQVEVLRATVQHEFSKKEQVEERNRAKLDGYLDILVKWGAMTPAAAARAKRKAKDGDLEDIRDVNTYISNHYFEDAYLRDLHDARKYLEGASK